MAPIEYLLIGETQDQAQRTENLFADLMQLVHLPFQESLSRMHHIWWWIAYSVSWKLYDS